MEGGDWAGKEMEVMGGGQNQVWGGTREITKNNNYNKELKRKRMFLNQTVVVPNLIPTLERQRQEDL